MICQIYEFSLFLTFQNLLLLLLFYLTHTAQFHKNKRPNQKMGQRTK